MNNSGNLYLKQSKIAKAKIMYLRAFTSKKKAKKSDYISILNNLY